MSLLLTLGSFFSLEVGEAQGLYACGVQPSRALIENENKEQ